MKPSSLLALLHCCALASCAVTPLGTDGAAAECPVCAHEGDLACLCVRVDADTPSCEFAGEVYYFCSEECRADFLREPSAYLRRR
jgi:hypothetical protein